MFVIDVVDVYFSQVELGIYAGGESEMTYFDIVFFGWDPSMIVEIQDRLYT
jgi:hypothetical protein